VSVDCQTSLGWSLHSARTTTTWNRLLNLRQTIRQGFIQILRFEGEIAGTGTMLAVCALSGVQGQLSVCGGAWRQLKVPRSWKLFAAYVANFCISSEVGLFWKYCYWILRAIISYSLWNATSLRKALHAGDHHHILDHRACQNTSITGHSLL